MNRKAYILVLILSLVAGLVGGALSVLLLTGPLAKFIKFKVIHAEMIRVDESLESKFIRGNIIKVDEYLESKVVHGKVNRGEQFLLVDSEGYPYGMWLHGSHGDARLSMTWEEGKSDLWMTSNGLSLSKDGKRRISLMVGNDGSPELLLLDKAGKPRVYLAMYTWENELPRLTFIDKNGLSKTFTAR